MIQSEEDGLGRMERPGRRQEESPVKTVGVVGNHKKDLACSEVLLERQCDVMLRNLHETELWGAVGVRQRSLGLMRHMIRDHCRFCSDNWENSLFLLSLSDHS